MYLYCLFIFLLDVISKDFEYGKKNVFVWMYYIRVLFYVFILV